LTVLALSPFQLRYRIVAHSVNTFFSGVTKFGRRHLMDKRVEEKSFPMYSTGNPRHCPGSSIEDRITMEARRQERCAASAHWYHNPEKERFCFMCESESVPARIAGIQPDGIGFEVYGPRALKVGVPAGAAESITGLYPGDVFIAARIHLAWRAERTAARTEFCRGGLTIDFISPEDRLHLHDFIERARNYRATARSQGAH
jgi:hypothetical protein